MKIDGQWWYFDDAKVAKEVPRGAHPRPVTSVVVLKRISA